MYEFPISFNKLNLLIQQTVCDSHSCTDCTAPCSDGKVLQYIVTCTKVVNIGKIRTIIIILTIIIIIMYDTENLVDID